MQTLHPSLLVRLPHSHSCQEAAVARAVTRSWPTAHMRSAPPEAPPHRLTRLARMRLTPLCRATRRWPSRCAAHMALCVYVWCQQALVLCGALGAASDSSACTPADRLQGGAGPPSLALQRHNTPSIGLLAMVLPNPTPSNRLVLKLSTHPPLNAPARQHASFLPHPFSMPCSTPFHTPRSSTPCAACLIG